MWRLSIQNHLKPSITEKRRNKSKYLTWNFIRGKFVKKTCMPINPVKSLGYIYSWLRRPKPYWKSEKRSHLSSWSAMLLFTSFSKTLLTAERRRIWWKVNGNWDNMIRILQWRERHCRTNTSIRRKIKFVRAWLWESQSGILVGKLTIWIRWFEIEKS